jgi:hypothetical protein
MALAAGTAAGADTSQPAPAPIPIDQNFCMRRDITPEEYAEKCVIKNGPPHRHILRKKGAREGVRNPLAQAAPMGGSGSSSSP